MGYVRNTAQPRTMQSLESRIAELLAERASLKRTIDALAGQVKALNATPVNIRKAVPVCGTHSGYQKHIRDKSTTCFACRAARAEYTRNYRKKLSTISRG